MKQQAKVEHLCFYKKLEKNKFLLSECQKNFALP